MSNPNANEPTTTAAIDEKRCITCAKSLDCPVYRDMVDTFEWLGESIESVQAKSVACEQYVEAN